MDGASEGMRGGQRTINPAINAEQHQTEAQNAENCDGIRKRADELGITQALSNWKPRQSKLMTSSKNSTTLTVQRRSKVTRRQELWALPMTKSKTSNLSRAREKLAALTPVQRKLVIELIKRGIRKPGASKATPSKT